LPDTAGNGNLQGILSEARSYGDKQAQSSLGRVLLRFPNRPIRVNSQDAQGQWVAEDGTTFQYLMSRTVKGSAQCGPARLSWLHEKSLAREATSQKKKPMEDRLPPDDSQQHAPGLKAVVP
jgi:hypothetical protein